MDLFAWDYFDLKGMDLVVYKHQINLKEDVVLVIQQRYQMNPNYAGVGEIAASLVYQANIKWSGCHQ